MKTYLLAFGVIFLFYSVSIGQEVRSFDGYNNNINNPEWGASGTVLQRYVLSDFADGISAPSGSDRMNPRQISNMIFAQDSKIHDKRNLSDFVWVFGQFIDHDITLTEDSPTEPAMIRVPMGDPMFDPASTGNVLIPMMRSLAAPGTGLDPSNPRTPANSITAFIDASAVYGSDDFRASWLRSHRDGKLKVSEDNLLPYNTLTGTYNSRIDHNAPEMANANPFNEKLFVAGDIRANENLLLTAYHTLFVREHNRLCDEFKMRNPNWDDERLYQHVRRFVSGFIQNIVLQEWLPAMGVYLDEYEGYNPAVNPGISDIFSGAAYRLGHTLLSGNIMRLDKDGEVIGQGNIELKDAFFNPHEVLLGGGIEPLFQGMAFQVQQNLDCKVVDDVRNFLFGPPGAGGLDLAAININRGRERGFADYASIREQIGLTPITDFSDITKDSEMANSLKAVYGNVNDIDAWVGLLAEDHMPDAMIGPSLMKFLKLQFSDVRDGDRFYFEVDPGLSAAERNLIRNTHMSDIIMRNTDIKIMQTNVFVAADPTSLIELEEAHLEILTYPNPFVDRIQVSLYSDYSGSGILELYDNNGRRLYQANESIIQGTNTLEIRPDINLPKGLYSVALHFDEEVSSSKILKVN